MNSTRCGACDLDWHQKRDSATGFSGWVYASGVGLHQWVEPTTETIARRLRERYGLV